MVTSASWSIATAKPNWQRFACQTLHKMYGPGSPTATSGQGEIWCSIVHPGLVESNLGQHASFPPWIKWTAVVFGKLGGRIHPDKGSWTSVFCVASPQMKAEQSGVYFQRIAEVGWQSRQAKDTTLAGKLEDWTKHEMWKWLKCIYIAWFTKPS